MCNLATKQPSIWIIGYGNSQRRDDGIGPYVVTKLREIVKDREGIHFLALHQLEPDLVFELQDATLVIFIDATVNELGRGWEWTRVDPELRNLPYLSHYFDPAFLLGLHQSLCNESPPAWMVSIKGDDFDIGEGVTQETENRACGVVAEIVKFLESDNLLEMKIPSSTTMEN
ncbi:MAG: hydrogenase maturation protease [Pseudomonadota bacterium]